MSGWCKHLTLNYLQVHTIFQRLGSNIKISAQSNPCIVVQQMNGFSYDIVETHKMVCVNLNLKRRCYRKGMENQLTVLHHKK